MTGADTDSPTSHKNFWSDSHSSDSLLVDKAPQNEREILAKSQNYLIKFLYKLLSLYRIKIFSVTFQIIELTIVMYNLKTTNFDKLCSLRKQCSQCIFLKRCTKINMVVIIFFPSGWQQRLEKNGEFFYIDLWCIFFCNWKTH